MRLQLIAISLLGASLIPGVPNQSRHRINTIQRSSTAAARRGSIRDYLRFVVRLRTAGASVKLTPERVEQPFFSVPARIVNINGEGVQVFRYANPSAADAQARLVARDGMTIGMSKPSWMGSPHFFKDKNLIVLYLGANESILKVLNTALNAQFAGS